MAARRTLAELVTEKFLIREQGRRAFVVKTLMQDQPRYLTNFTEDTERRGLSTSRLGEGFQNA